MLNLSLAISIPIGIFYTYQMDELMSQLRGVQFSLFIQIVKSIYITFYLKETYPSALCKYSVDPDQTPHFAASDLVNTVCLCSIYGAFCVYGLTGRTRLDQLV